MNKTIAYHTLGCKLNFSETAEISHILEMQDYKTISFNESADIYVINTCSVTGTAEKKCRQAIHKAHRKNPLAKIVVIGCYAQLRSEELLKIPGVSLVLGTGEKFKLPEYLDKLPEQDQAEIHSCLIEDVNLFSHANSGQDRTRTFLKIQDGCDYHCAYCTIPLARGKSRNPEISEIIQKAKSIAKTSSKEIILSGVNIGDFGKSTNQNFLELITELDKVTGIERYRISSIEPNLLTDEIIQFVADSGKFMPHFHIPLQSGSNKILKLMRRRYLREVFESRVKKIKELMPDAGIGADVIVGFPGESEEDFRDVYHFIKGLDVSYLHVFSFSARPNTPAYSMDKHVPHAVIEERSKLLHELSVEKKKQFYNSQLKKSCKVLFEGKAKKGIISGFSDNYLRVQVQASDSSYSNEVLSVINTNYIPPDIMQGVVVS